MTLSDPCPVPVGTRVVMVSMPHDPDPVPRGERGTVTGGNGEQVFVDWDNGRSLHLLVGVDVWAVIDDNMTLEQMLIAHQDQRHDCAEPGCQHVATYADEAFCWYHEPPIHFEHDCLIQNCKHWRST